jgi:hypothetical protein
LGTETTSGIIPQGYDGGAIPLIGLGDTLKRLNHEETLREIMDINYTSKSSIIVELWRSNMNNPGKKILNATLIAAFIFATVLLVGCGDNELVKGITGVVKKSVEGEVSKKVGEVKKQFDQVVNLGVGKGPKEVNQGDAKADKDKSKKDSGKESDKKD